MPSASLPSRRQCNSLKWRTQTCKRRRDKCETVPRRNLVALIPPSPFLPVPSAKPLHVAVNVLRAQLFSSLCDRKVLWLKALFCVWSRRKGLTSADQLGSTVGSRAHLLPKGFVSPMVSETMCLKNLVNKCWKTLRFENQCVSSWRNRKTGPSWGCHPPDKEWHWAAVPSTHTHRLPVRLSPSGFSHGVVCVAPQWVPMCNRLRTRNEITLDLQTLVDIL
jgi:hypothetical protein